MASAVPQEPAPITVIGAKSGLCMVETVPPRGPRLVDEPRLRLLRRLREQRVEIHQREQEVRESALGDQIRDDFAGIGKQNARTEASDQSLHVLRRSAADRENTGLLHFHQIQRGVALFGLQRDGQEHLAHVRRELVSRGVHVELELRLPILVVGHPRPIRRFVRAVLQIDTLQAHLHARHRRPGPFVTDLVHQAPWISRSSSPEPSSAKRSSQPPTNSSPMKICGTVRLPERAIISSRSFPSSSTSISVNSSPLLANSARTRWQYGHHPVAYTTIAGWLTWIWPFRRSGP